MIPNLLGLYKNSNLISIGIISEDGKEFYGEIEDIKNEWTDNWIEENVLVNTVAYGGVDVLDIVNSESDYYIGSKEEVAEYLREWLSQFDKVELVSDVCHYDMVLFIDLFGTAFDLPDNICPACYDINQDIARVYNLSEQEAFDYNREEILKENNIDTEGAKHNAMYDARVIKTIYELLNN